MQELPEAEAEGKVKVAFDDIKATLGIPTVGPLFRRLAVYPWYLQLAWRNLKPNAATVYFHRMAGELKQLAGSSAARIGPGTQPSSHDATLDTLSKLLMATATLRCGANGQVPKLQWISAGDKQVITPSSVAEVASSVEIAEVGADTDDPAFQARADELRNHAAIAAESSPYRMEISASASRQSGLTEDQIDAVRQIINESMHSLPRVLLAKATAPSRRPPQPAGPSPVAAG